MNASDFQDVTIDEGAQVGVSHSESSDPPEIGPGSMIRSGTIVYDDVVAGPSLTTGHQALIREGTTLGADVLVGTQTVIDGACTLGNGVSLQTGVYVPRETTIGDRAFLGPNATLTNDRYPVRTDTNLTGPTVEADASIGANATILPDVTIGAGSFVAAGSIVTDDVPPETLAIGSPARHESLPSDLKGGNDL